MIAEIISQAEFHRRLSAQGVPAPRFFAFICPVCATVQNAQSLIAAGLSEADAMTTIGFSCVGRWTGAGPWPAISDDSAEAKARRETPGCTHTLGGLFRLNALTVRLDSDEDAPSFALASPEQAQALASRQLRETTPETQPC